LKKDNENVGVVPTVEELREELKLRHHEKVSEYIRNGVLDQLEEDELDIYRGISSLRDIKLTGLVLKKKGSLNPEWFRIANEDYNNNSFICQVFKKYRKAFNWKDKEVCNSIFEIAFSADDLDTIRYFIRKKKMTEKYPVLASGSNDMFELLLKQNFKKWDNDRIVELYVYAASVPYGKNRVKELHENGVDPTVQNSDGMTAEQVFEAQIKSSSGNLHNKSGELKKNQDQRVLRYLQKITREGKRRKKINPKMIYIPAMVVFVAAVLGFLCYVIKHSNDDDYDYDDYDYDYDYEEDDDSYDTASDEDADYSWLYDDEEESYLTDTSLSVAEGDTVNIDYTGYIDGVEFDGGSTDGYGTDLEIGSGDYIDGFEDQLVGHYVGETVEVNVTFPEDYGDDDLNGKDAVFEVTINGIY
jgi:trigger factor